MAAPSPCSTTPRFDGYERRRPDETLLYQLIEEHWPTFLERAEQSGGLPDFIVEEFEAYLRCGLLEHGLAHFACRQCGESLAVAFSCKKRGFCPSCMGRRMADVAAHLVDEVFPEVPVRQWVCSLLQIDGAAALRDGLRPPALRRCARQVARPENRGGYTSYGGAEGRTRDRGGGAGARKP